MTIRNRRICEIIKKYNTENVGSILDNPEMVAKMIKSILDGMEKQDRDKEIFFSIGLDVILKIKYIEIISIGGLNSALASPRELFRTPFIKGGIAQLIIAHNHPSGDITPSEDDILITHRFKKAGDLLNIPVIDHIIVAIDGKFFSFKANKLIKEKEEEKEDIQNE
jgi:DNA repair protein RadC